MLSVAPASLAQTFLVGSAGTIVAASAAALAAQPSATLVTSLVRPARRAVAMHLSKARIEDVPANILGCCSGTKAVPCGGLLSMMHICYDARSLAAYADPPLWACRTASQCASRRCSP